MAELIRRKKRIDRGVKVRSDGIYAVSSPRELMFLFGPRLALVLGLLLAPLVVPGLYWNRVICLVGVYGLLAISLDFLANTVGLVCLGTAFSRGRRRLAPTNPFDLANLAKWRCLSEGHAEVRRRRVDRE